MKEGVKYIDLVWEKLDNWYTQAIVHLPNVLVGLIFFFIVFKFSTAITKLIEKFLRKNIPQKADVIPTIMGAIRFFVILIGTFISLEIIGLSGMLWKFIGSLGVAGVIAGVALKDLVSSIFSGMLVSVDKAFKVDDYISIGNYSGTVQEIGFLTTKILTDDGKKVYIPNQVIFSAPFFNVTASPQRRVILSIEIPSGVDMKKIQSTLVSEIKKLEELDNESNVDVVFTNISRGNYVLEIKFWILPRENFVQARSKAILLIDSVFRNEKIDLITPTSVQVISEMEE